MDSNTANSLLSEEKRSTQGENEITSGFVDLQQFISLQAIPLQILDNTLVCSITSAEHLSMPTKNNHNKDELKVLSMIGTPVESLPTEEKNIKVPNVTVGIDSVISLECIENHNIEDNRRSKKDKIIKNYVHIHDTVVLQRAYAVLPTSLMIRMNAVTPRKQLPPRVLFGPIQGVKMKISLVEKEDLKMKAALNNKPLYFLKNGNHTIHLDVSDKDKANWISLLPLGNQYTANVWIFQKDDELYGLTTEVVPIRRTLCVGYSKSYFDEHQIDDKVPIKDLHEESSNRDWWCYECCKPMFSENTLQKHIETHHQERKNIPKKRYRCRYCTRVFSRLFTLKRHLARHCNKNSILRDQHQKNSNIEQNSIDSSHNLSQSIEDNRTASDESFQNYTNGLDFSTNLFDDRMAGLDITNTKNETEFNPYSLEDRVDNILTGHIEFQSTLQRNEKQNENVPVSEKNNLVSCSFCNADIEKENKRKHAKECRKSHLECECGRIFRNKVNLAEHIYSDHSKKMHTARITKPKESTGPTERNYSCEMCDQKFKRRGILVNHLWRVHNISDSKVPLEKRVRHFPCVVCPKVYRSAAKRNQHVKIHHPGAESLPAQCIEGGVRRYEPARCSFCPRQYATRAKMLQHARRHHAHLMKRRAHTQ